jgi:hypothetical protein
MTRQISPPGYIAAAAAQSINGLLLAAAAQSINELLLQLNQSMVSCCSCSSINQWALAAAAAQSINLFNSSSTGNRLLTGTVTTSKYLETTRTL